MGDFQILNIFIINIMKKYFLYGNIILEKKKKVNMYIKRNYK